MAGALGWPEIMGSQSGQRQIMCGRVREAEPAGGAQGGVASILEGLMRVEQEALHLVPRRGLRVKKPSFGEPSQVFVG